MGTGGKKKIREKSQIFHEKNYGMTRCAAESRRRGNIKKNLRGKKWSKKKKVSILMMFRCVGCITHVCGIYHVYVCNMNFKWT